MNILLLTMIIPISLSMAHPHIWRLRLYDFFHCLDLYSYDSQRSRHPPELGLINVLPFHYNIWKESKQDFNQDSSPSPNLGLIQTLATPERLARRTIGPVAWSGMSQSTAWSVGVSLGRSPWPVGHGLALSEIPTQIKAIVY